MVNVLSSDGKQDLDVIAANASSSATLMLSDVPWNGLIDWSKTVGRLDGKIILLLLIK
jgi:polyribonucleotide nucleotidyltransferase